jgi:hypothetical protein
MLLLLNAQPKQKLSQRWVLSRGITQPDFRKLHPRLEQYWSAPGCRTTNDRHHHAVLPLFAAMRPVKEAVAPGFLCFRQCAINAPAVEEKPAVKPFNGPHFTKTRQSRG